MSTNLWFVCTVWLIQTDDYMFQARMFSGVMTGNLCIRVCDEFCFCCVLLIFSEGGIFRMDDDSSIMNCSKRVVDKRRWGWFVLWLTTPSQPVIHPNYYMYNVCFRSIYTSSWKLKIKWWGYAPLFTWKPTLPNNSLRYFCLTRETWIKTNRDL